MCYDAFNPFPKRQILDSSKMKEFADDSLKLDENGGRFSKSVQNTVGKGEIARHEQFLLFLQCFQKACAADTYKPGLVWERVNSVLIKLKFDFSLLFSKLFLYQKMPKS